jgi:hypothetical protein
MLCDCIPARSDGRSSQCSLGLGDLNIICLERLISKKLVDFFTIVWWRFPYQRAMGTVRDGVQAIGYLGQFTRSRIARGLRILGLTS